MIARRMHLLDNADNGRTERNGFPVNTQILEGKSHRMSHLP